MRTAVRYISLIILGLSVVSTAACVQLDSPDATCPEGWDLVTEYQLFFGRSGAGGQEVVSENAWAQFLADTVTPRFPDGLTVTDGAGQWLPSEGKVVRERTKILTILVWPDESPLDKLDEIATEYERRFGQDSVLRASRQACASFS